MMGVFAKIVKMVKISAKTFNIDIWEDLKLGWDNEINVLNAQVAII